MPDTGIRVFVGVDMAKTEHFAHVVTVDGEELFVRSVANDEATSGWLIDDAALHSRVAVVVDMTACGAELLLSVATWGAGGVCDGVSDAPRRAVVCRVG